MKWPYNPAQPFKVRIDQIEDEVDFATIGNAAHTPKQVVIIAYNLIFQTGLFPEACREWRKKNAVTTQQTGYHSTNAAIHTDYNTTTAEALTNLAFAMKTNRFSIAQLTKANQSLTNQLVASNEKLNATRADIQPTK